MGVPGLSPSARGGKEGPHKSAGRRTPSQNKAMRRRGLVDAFRLLPSTMLLPFFLLVASSPTLLASAASESSDMAMVSGPDKKRGPRTLVRTTAGIHVVCEVVAPSVVVSPHNAKTPDVLAPTETAQRRRSSVPGDPNWPDTCVTVAVSFLPGEPRWRVGSICSRPCFGRVPLAFYTFALVFGP
ncbi:hypothetical protein HPB50_011994 [Hyalomma asiaticum]|uniref:Uncharacterized protein n=1 Tax=Hyalomma asiaticum TaxID=266040 RepID=A0ACB7SVS9_HYAAI|nr:hypothetical protein HPB50_011994 [Hyalomma asiaticum]